MSLNKMQIHEVGLATYPWASLVVSLSLPSHLLQRSVCVKIQQHRGVFRDISHLYTIKHRHKEIKRVTVDMWALLEDI